MRRTNNNGTGFAFIVAVGLLGIIGIGSSANADKQDNSPNDQDRQIDSHRPDRRRPACALRADSPRKARDIGVVVGLQGVTAHSSVWTTGIRTGSFTESGTVAVYTPSIHTASSAGQYPHCPLRGGLWRGLQSSRGSTANHQRTGQPGAQRHRRGDGRECVADVHAPPAAPVPAMGVTGAATRTTTSLRRCSNGNGALRCGTTMDQIVIQSPPGNGILVAAEAGFDAGPSAGVDIYSHVESGVTVANTAFATLSVNGTYSFYRVNLTTGARGSSAGSTTRCPTSLSRSINRRRAPI